MTKNPKRHAAVSGVRSRKPRARARARKVLYDQWQRARKERGINEETVAFGVGPLELDVSMARDHGWSEQQIKRVAEVIEKIASREGDRAIQRHPERWERGPDGVVVFIGPSTSKDF